MLEQESFLKKLAWLADYAGECGNVLTKDEVEKALSGMELAEQQFDLIRSASSTPRPKYVLAISTTSYNVASKSG